MPRHRSLNLKKFIDSIPESLIEEYFKQKVEGGVSFSLKAFDYDSVNKFLDTIQDEDLKSTILEDFTHINDICEKMMNILVKAVQRYGIETTGEEERQALAMDIFLHHKEAFDYAYDFYCLFNASSKMNLKELLGHKTLTMTLRYAHLAPAHKMQAVKVLDQMSSVQKLHN